MLVMLHCNVVMFAACFSPLPNSRNPYTRFSSILGGANQWACLLSVSGLEQESYRLPALPDRFPDRTLNRSVGPSVFFISPPVCPANPQKLLSRR